MADVLGRVRKRTRRVLRDLGLLKEALQTSLVVPPQFNRNSPSVTSLMTPEESGRWLLERMRQHLGFADYADKRVLDFGCGVRFSQALINTRLPVARYVGVDIHRPMIEFLQTEVWDDRFSYVFLDAYHPLYNPHGTVLSPDTPLAVPTSAFDVACLFSVITHQHPSDSACIFSILRRHINRTGRLFFTCFLDESIPTFEDRSPERNGGRCFYNPGFIVNLAEGSGWRLVARVPGEGPLIGDSFVFRGT